jgi:hypothetical protein
MKHQQQHLPPHGRPCLITPEHGLSFVVGKGNAEWCPHSDHLIGPVSKLTPQLLVKQQAYLDDLAAKQAAS